MDPNESSNYHRLSVHLRGVWHLIQRDYLHYFEYYDCSTVDYGEMKAAVHQYILDKIEELSMNNSMAAEEAARFWLYAMDNYEQNLDLCMDIYLLDSMWHFQEHLEAEDIEWYIMYKYGPY
uniref:Uncharacterized protein n=1 Tax=Caenorhabditis tropicalis TaxID=1561998 RepID=A0A1I7TLM1_9PELO